ncbi:Fe-S cluster assembly transcriptional regulator IscR [Pusillimonas sp. MFBS29]|uniref:Fe-S cluster assembly transcriptional regulator IscR n=1 Tax=Pusillimonas sp. MFBS29 TaxID=2886690 RepID=UPI001D12FABE|nr:Fe-S cluster assembly transcriptional regulator IscR [Pusillimonas sp. MFBS29]MCC2596770.1 Fe-S cluster assembly transcriptional regulator IscR [Pusillimonas sp. MFBS29]
MRLTTKGRFAVTAMIDLALRQNSGPVTLAAISERQNISLSYLEQLFGKLRRHELVDSVRGPGGGYSLATLARNITVADIIFAVDEPLDATSCGGKENCNVGRNGSSGKCMTHELWSNLNRKMIDYLDSVSLQDLADQERMRQLQESSRSKLPQSATIRINRSPDALIASTQ